MIQVQLTNLNALKFVLFPNVSWHPLKIGTLVESPTSCTKN